MSSEIFVMVLGTSVVLMLFVGVVFFTVSRLHKQRLEQEVKEKDLELNYQKELRRAETDISESVMQYISYELHDNVQHSLTHLRLQLELFMNRHPDAVTEVLPLETTLDETTDQLRNLCRRLNTDFITENSFVSSLQLEVVKLQKLKKFNVQWSYDERPPDIDKEQLLTTFRICQEIINNILKHSKARNISIILSGSREWHLKIADDGIGFDPEQAKKEGRLYGINNLQKRARQAGLTCSLDTSTGSGCSYIIKPVTYSQEPLLKTEAYG